MELQSFIQSGLLEFYALGQVTAEERSLVERMLSQHAEARTELTAIEQAVESYATALGTPPPAWMKGRILDQIAQLPLPKVPAATPVPLGGISFLWRALQLLALLLLLAGAFLWNRNNQLRDENAAQQVQLVDCDRRSTAKEPLLAMFQDTNTQIIRIKGLAGSAIVYYNPILRQVMLNTNSVPPTANVYYQCWAIVGDQKIDLGVVQKDAVDGWQTLRYVPNAQHYAISAEDNPNGKPAPSNVAMISDKLGS